VAVDLERFMLMPARAWGGSGEVIRGLSRQAIITASFIAKLYLRPTARRNSDSAIFA